MFERFTPRARQVIVVAQEEAKSLRHHLIRPEHLMIGLIQGDGIAAKALRDLGVSLEAVRGKLETATTQRPKSDKRASKVPFSPGAKRALELSLREALKLGHNYIGTEHIVLGVLQVLEDESDVSELLGVDAEEIREHVAEFMANNGITEFQQSSAAKAAMRLARQLAGPAPVTTGHLLLAVLSDPTSHAGKALETLGVSDALAQERLAAILIDDTSDAPPRPQSVEIKLGETTTSIGDPELAAALRELSPEQLRIALRGALGVDPAHTAGGSEQAS